MKLKSHTSSLSLWIVAALSLSFCGKKSLRETKHTGDLELPSLPSPLQGNQLAENSQPAEYNGGILLWDKNVSSDDVARLFKASGYAHGTFVKYLKYHDAMIKPQKLILQKKEKEIQDLANLGDKSVLASRFQNSMSWFANQLATSTLTEEQKSIANKRFARYCEAKLWETASSPVIAGKDFLQRPSSSALCEKVYEEQQRFKSEECGAPTQGAKNYFACYWNEMVNTSIFDSLFSVEKKQELALLAKDEQLRNKVTDPSLGFTNAILGASNVPDLDSPYRSKFMVTVTPSGAKKDTAVEVATARTILNSVDSASSVLSTLESRRAECTANPFLPVCKTWIDPNLFKWVSAEGASTEVANWNDKVTERIENFSKKKSFGALEASVQEVIFVYPQAIPAIPRPEGFNLESAGNLPEVFVGEESSDQKLKDLRVTVDVEKQKLSALMVPVTLPAEGCNLVGEAAKQNLACLWSSMTLHKMQAAGKPGVAYAALPQVNLKVTPSADKGNIVVELKLAGASSKKSAIGCVALNEKTPTQCSPEVYSGKVPMKAAQDVKSGKWILTLPLGNSASDLGLGHRERILDDKGQLIDPNFNDLETEFFAGKILYLELVPNKYENYLPYLSGDVAILNASGQMEVGGSATNLVENTFVKSAMGETP